MKLAGYKKGDEIVFSTSVWSSIPQSGEEFKTEHNGIVIAEGQTELNEYGELYQQRIIVRSEHGTTHIRAAYQLQS